MLSGAMDAMVVGDPGDPATDVGPVIDRPARDRVLAHVDGSGLRVLHRTALPAGLPNGWWVAPTLIGLDRAEDLTEEVFGPVVHVVRFAAGDLDRVIDRINASGYGLTLGLHTRIDETVRRVKARARVGNLYVNRSMIGAVVGVQPFGGEGLSGTGPKAGGPRYLHRFAVERTVSVDTTSAGGNAHLVAMDEG
jgi:RHH-type transcriptional regulator, proline utilization regulon repressor / proline dehydrogenase / delta 1-pyrroline-5-carboxylate dehydrogenase